MWLQPHPEIWRAHARVDDCHDDQDNGNDSETRQTLPDWKVIPHVAGLVHSCQLENKVSQSAEEQEQCNDHSKIVLTTSPEGCHKQDNDGDGNGGDRKRIFGVWFSSNDDKKLYCESEEEEEIELQQSNIDLDDCQHAQTQVI